MRFFILLGLCASCLCLSCSSTGESQGSDVDAAAEDTLQADSSNDLLLDDTLHPDTKPLDTIDPDLAQPDLFQPECTVDSDCADLVDSACLVGTCDEGNCVVSDAADGTVCDDGNGCTQTDACQAGVCTGGNPVVCPLPDPCHDTGVCDPATGICSNPAEVDGTPCDDGNEATGGDSCKAGLCLGEGCVCNTFGACCNGCFALNQGGACSDDNDCTQTDACQDGFCVGSNPVVCEALDQCHEAGTCAPATGLCSNPTKADSTFCDDGDGRTAVDKCLDGVCAGTPCTCDTIDTCCDGCLGINTGVKCWEGAQHGGLCTAEGVCHDPSRWAVVALTEIGISTIDTQNEVVYGPFLNGWLGSEGGGRFDVAVSPDGLTAVVSNFGDSTIHFVDLTDPTEPLPLGTVLMPMFAEDVAFTPDGKFVLVTDGGFSKYIVVVDAATRTVVETFVQNGVEANSVSVAPDGTVVVTDYFRGQVHSLRIDGQGHLTHVGSHTVYVNIEGDVSLEKGKHTIRPVNVFISPNGKTVLVSDVTKYNETPTLMDPVIDAGYAYYAMVVFEIVSPGVLEFKGEVKRVPAAAQSAAFSDDGKHAYILGNSMWYRGDVNEEFVQVEDHLVVLDIAQTGEVTLNPSVMPNLKRTIGSQLFGVDNIVVIKGKAYVTHSSLSGATKNVSVVDLSTYKVSRLLMEGIPIGIAVAPMNDFDAPFVPGPATCQGKCGGMNQAAHCGCDEACKDWNDCCFDVDLHCQGCNSETCKGNNRVCEMLPNGTFGCGCTWGLVYGGPAGCLDVDECALGLNNCIEGSTCMNQQGNFWCQCPKTMIWDSFGSCLCPKGFVGDLASGCTDIDECANGNGPCKDSATCVNHDGYYSCECEAPFDQDGMDGCQCPEGREFDGIGECVDIDECADGTGPCKDGSTCVNYDGYHECVCQAPFQSDGFDGCECPWGYAPDEVEGCVEIDECAVEPCGDSALCVDQVGYFECICEWPMESDGMLGCYCVWGYTPDGAGSCVEIDECAAQPCHDGATCIDNVGSFECVCEPPLEPDWMNGCQCPWGYVSDGVGGCLNIDDCANNPCGDEVTCVDYLGYYQCVCDWPMQWDGAESCVCPGGYQPDGLGGCEDIDECTGNPCDGGAVCHNYDGYYQCACQWPFQPDGANGCVCSGGFFTDESGGCVDIDECLDNVCGSLDCINYDGSYECLCNWPLQWDGGSNCICPEGFRWDEFGACVDINECAEGTHGCWEDETCYNEPGWYWCW